MSIVWPPVTAATAPWETPPTDKELLRAHIEGDSGAFGTLIARHRDRLWAVALRTTGDRDEAADALQDALVSAFRRANNSVANRRSPPGCTESW